MIHEMARLDKAAAEVANLGRIMAERDFEIEESKRRAQKERDILAGKLIPANRIEFVEKFRQVKGAPFSFQGRDYLREIYLDESLEINIVKARQMEITEFALNWLTHKLTLHPHTIGLYMTDRFEHIKDFSDRFQSAVIEPSPVLKSLMVPTKNSVAWKKFKNKSNLRMLSAWGDFESARSIAADFVVVDEMQSVNVGALSIVKESMSKSKYHQMIKIGTGSDEGDEWYEEWCRGTQYHWKKDFVNQDGSCGAWVQDPKSPTVPGKTSYAISQSMAPWISAEAIEAKRTGGGYPPRQFENEVLGWWHRGMKRPLTAKEMMTLFDQNLDFTPSENVDHTLPVYAGFDWGGGTQAFTVAWIWQLVNEILPPAENLETFLLSNLSLQILSFLYQHVCPHNTNFGNHFFVL
jgi:hypothetical protein